MLLLRLSQRLLRERLCQPIDEAIRAYRALDVAAYTKLDEVPYDFMRKRLSILVRAVATIT